MAIYQSKPIRIEAVQWAGDNGPEVIKFAQGKIHPRYNANGLSYELELLAGVDGAQGWVDVPVGHWIVCQPGDKSDMWPVADAFFISKYELDETQVVKIIRDFHTPYHKYINLGNKTIGHIHKKGLIWQASSNIGFKTLGEADTMEEAAQIVDDNYRPGNE